MTPRIFEKSPAGFRRTFADETKAPFDEMRIGKLQDHAISDTPGTTQRLRSITGDPHRRHSCSCPCHFDGMSFVFNRVTSGKIAHDTDSLFKIVQCQRFFPMTRRELSPRPIPISMRPCEIWFRVAIKLAVTVASRTTGFVTHVPNRMR